MDQFYRFTPALRIHKRHFTHTKFIFIDCWIHPLPLDFLYKRVNMFSKFFLFPSIQRNVSKPCSHIRLKRFQHIPWLSPPFYLFCSIYLGFGASSGSEQKCEIFPAKQTLTHIKQNKTQCRLCEVQLKFHYNMTEECREELPLFLISRSSWRTPRRTLERAPVLNTGCEFIINGILL